MTEQLKNFIENNISLIEDDNFIELYSIAEDVSSIESAIMKFGNIFHMSELTQTLLDSGIDVFQYILNIPDRFARGCTLPNSTIQLNTGCKSVGTVAFSSTNLEQIVLPKTLEYISDYAFCNTSLKNVDIPNAVLNIGVRAFADCSELTKVVLGNSITELKSWTFENCFALTQINIPKSVKRLNNNVFSGCVKLTTIDYAGSISEWKKIETFRYWYENSGIQTVNCSDGVVTI